LYSHALSPVYKLGVSLSTRGSSKRYYQNNGDGKGYQIWRISTTHDFPFKASRFKIQSVRLEFGVDNIFNYVDRTMHPYHLGTNTSGTTVYGTFSIKFSGGKRVKQNNILSTKQNNNDENSD
jgi:outer membrane receptor for ferrienterochelin and colicins